MNSESGIDGQYKSTVYQKSGPCRRRLNFLSLMIDDSFYGNIASRVFNERRQTLSIHVTSEEHFHRSSLVNPILMHLFPCSERMDI